VLSNLLTRRRSHKRNNRNSFDLNAFLAGVELTALRVAVTIVFLAWVVRHLIQELWK